MVSTQARVGSVNVLLSVSHGQASASLNAFATGVERTGVRVATGVRGMDRSLLSLNATAARLNAGGFRGLTISALRAGDSVTMLTRAAQALVAVSGGLGLALGATAMIQMSDRATRLTNSLRTVTSGTSELNDVQEALFNISQRTRSSFEATATIYSRTARATETLGFSQEKLLRLTETVQKSFAIGGATTAEAQGAAIQLSQGIASDRFSGEEFRSVAENAPVLLRGMAESLGVTIGKLREMAHAGELTARVVTQAIVDASARIDEEFGRTTATIGQAVQYLDNAILKYVQDSSEVSAASQAVVGGLRSVADNIGPIVSALLLLGATMTATFAGRRLQAIQSSVSAMKATRLAAVDAAAAQERLALATASATRSEWTRQRLAFNKALLAGSLTTAQLERQKKSLSATTRQYHASVAAAQVATLQHSAAMKAATVSSMALSTAGRAVSAAWSFIGGWFGVAMLAVGAAMYATAARAAEVSERTDRYAEAIRGAGGASLNSASEIREAAQALYEVGAAATEASVRLKIMTAEDDLTRFSTDAQIAIRSLGALNGWSSVDIQAQLQALWQEFVTGKRPLEEFLAETDKLSDLDPNTTKIIDKIQGIARSTIAALEALNLYKSGLSSLGSDLAPKGDRVGTATMDQRQEEFDFLKNLALRTNPDLFPSTTTPRGSTRATADDRFDNSVQSIYDRIEALRLERETMNMNLYEQVRREEALKLEQEALKQAREEARRKGETDWQSAQISAEKRAEIDRVTAALAAETVATRQAAQEQEAWNTAAGDTGGLLAQLREGSITLTDALMEMSKILLKLLNDMNLAGGGQGIFGGGAFQSLIGGFLGLSFHGGGTVGSGGNVVQFPTGAPFAGKFHGGGNFGSGGAHGEVLALVEENETIFTQGDTRRIMSNLAMAGAALQSQPARQEVLVRGVFIDDGGVVKMIAQNESMTASARVANAVPAISAGSMDEGRKRRIRPRGGF